MRLLSLLVFASCSPLTHVRHVDPVEIRAYSPAVADHVARAVPGALAAVETLPSIRHPEQVLVLVHEGTEGRVNRGQSTPDQVDLWLDPHLEAASWQSLGFLFTHELTHHYLSDEWLILPLVVEEGLADLTAMRAEPSIAPLRKLANRQLLSEALSDPGSFKTFLSGVDVPRGHPFDDEAKARKPLETALGWYLVDRIGIDGLASLVEAAHAKNLGSVPWSWIYARADVDPDHPERWKVSGLISFGP